jgi:hypothetical protein
MSTNKKPRPVSKPAADAPGASAASTSTESLPAADLSFDLGSALASDPNSPIVTITTPTPNEAAMRERFEQHGSTQIEASALMPGIGCPFTQGCAEKGGKVRILSDVTVPKKLEDGRTLIQRVQQYHCNHCKCVAAGTKAIGGAAVGGPKLFNRLTGKPE